MDGETIFVFLYIQLTVNSMGVRTLTLCVPRPPAQLKNLRITFFLRFIYFRESSRRGGAEGERNSRRLCAERGA